MSHSRLSRGVLAFLLLLISASCDATTDPGGGGSADGFSLLIERRNAAGSRSFYTMSARTGRVAPFIGVPTDARAVFPSPDGSLIALLRQREDYVELWTMDRDGANRRPVLAGDWFIEGVSWSPDGSRFVIGFSTDDVNGDIAVVNADGSGFVNLTPDAGSAVIFDRDPAWSPDGKRIAFTSNRSGLRRLWTMAPDGSSPQYVTDGIESTERAPAWSPDGSFIAFMTQSGIGFVRPNGTDFSNVPIFPGPNEPAWLPDGRLVYSASPTGDFDIYSLDRLTGVSTQITSRRDNDVRAVALVDVAPYSWLGFGQPVTYRINRPVAVDIAAADVLTDGFDDVLVLSPLLNELRLMRGTAGGALQQVGSLYADSRVTRIATGRVNDDLAPDVVGLGDSAAYLWRGRPDGPGIATAIPLGGAARDFVVIDADASGRDDIVSLVEHGTQPFRIKTHTIGAGDAVVFAVDMQTTRSNGRRLCAGDFNNDAHADLAILTGATSLVALTAMGRGELGFDQPSGAGTTLNADPDAFPYCADFNGDGRDDMALLSIDEESSVSVHLFQSSAFSAPSRITARASDMAFADVDRDGDIDIVIASSTAAEILVARNRGDGRFTTPSVIRVQAIPTRIVAADLNGDLWPDIAAIDTEGTLVVLISRGRTGM